jgi:hypothetical protein
MSSNQDDDYKTLRASKPKLLQEISKTDKNRKGFLQRKYLKIKKALGDFWVLGGWGFKFGGLVGLTLGAVFGGFESIRMKSIYPMPAAMIGFGLFFGGIFAVSSILKSKDGKFVNQNKYIYHVVFLDKDGVYKHRSMGLTQKNDFRI